MAKRFRFRLETIRRVRKQAEDAQKRLVAHKLQEVVQTRSKIDGINEALRAESDSIRFSQGAGVLDVPMLRYRQFYLTSLRNRLFEMQESLLTRNKALNIERKKLAELSAKRKALDKLREKRWQAHQEALRRQEQTETDEVAVMRFVRSAASVGCEN